MKENKFDKVKVDEIVFRNYILTAYIGKNNYLYYTIKKRWYSKDGEVTQKISIGNNEVGELMSNLQRLVIVPNKSYDKYNRKKIVQDDLLKK